MSKSAAKGRTPRSITPRPGLGLIRLQRGFSQESLAETIAISKGSIQRIEEGDAVSPDSLKIYGAALGLEWDDLVPTDSPTPSPHKIPDTEIGSWMIYSSGPWTTAANGLQWKLHELRHKHVRDRKARGKLYDLRQHLAWQTLDDIKHWLTRHAEVSDRIKNLSAHVGRNIDCCLDESRRQHWWVIDEWIEGPSLQESAKAKPLTSDHALKVMLDVADVLQALHKEKLICRALAPQSIYLASAGTVVSDFELTKIVEGGRTVASSAKWPEWDVFIAPEVRDREKVSPAVDLYSWAMILAYALTGQNPVGHDGAKQTIIHSKLPEEVITFAIACLGPKGRPQSFDPILALGHRT